MYLMTFSGSYEPRYMVVVFESFGTGIIAQINSVLPSANKIMNEYQGLKIFIINVYISYQ